MGKNSIKHELPLKFFVATRNNFQTKWFLMFIFKEVSIENLKQLFKSASIQPQPFSPGNSRHDHQKTQTAYLCLIALRKFNLDVIPHGHNR